MFVATNISNNPLRLSDDTMIASGDSRKLKTVGDFERKYESLNWLSIVEEVKEESKPAEKTDGGKKQ